MDAYPESAFMNVGTIEEAIEKSNSLMAQSMQSSTVEGENQ